MKILRVGILSAALVAAAVATGGAGGGCTNNELAGKVISNEQGVLDGAVIDEKVMIGLHASVYGAATAASEATKTTPPLIVKGSPEALKVKAALQNAEIALALADSAYRTGDADTLKKRISEVQGFVAEVWGLTSKK